MNNGTTWSGGLTPRDWQRLKQQWETYAVLLAQRLSADPMTCLERSGYVLGPRDCTSPGCGNRAPCGLPPEADGTKWQLCPACVDSLESVPELHRWLDARMGDNAETGWAHIRAIFEQGTGPMGG